MAHPALTTDGNLALKSNIISMSTVGDAITQNFFLKEVMWNPTTGITSTWALHVEQSTKNTATTYAFPLIGSSAAGWFPGGGHTTVGVAQGPFVFPFNCVVYGLVLSTISGGSITIVKGYMSGPEVAW